MGFHERVAFGACFSGYFILINLGERSGMTSINSVNFPWIFRPSLYLLLSSFPKSLRACGLLWGVLWRLGAILWHIHGFSTDT